MLPKLIQDSFEKLYPYVKGTKSFRGIYFGNKGDRKGIEFSCTVTGLDKDKMSLAGSEENFPWGKKGNIYINIPKRIFPLFNSNKYHEELSSCLDNCLQDSGEGIIAIGGEITGYKTESVLPQLVVNISRYYELTRTNPCYDI